MEHRVILPADVPPSTMAAILLSYPREHLEALTEALLVAQDVLDGDPDCEIEDRAGETVPVIDDPDLPPNEDDHDPDIEANGDELDGSGAEDDFMRHTGYGPGCIVADPDLAIDDDDTGHGGVGDRTYAEWHTLPASTRRAGSIEGKPLRDWQDVHEDAEEDDPAGQYDEDNYTGPLPKQIGAGCEINGDREYNGDEGDYSNGLPFWEG